MARCKFYVASEERYPHGGRKFKLQTAYDPTIPEDVSFTKATPSGSMEVLVDNEAAFPSFALGSYVYVDVTAVPEAEAQE